ncbi:MAG: tetratricopeptide repeat protein [Myxococcaceae bacterium]|nr:tetratricopeptide repeat protein [Myxococcaceae bacterium]
MTRPTRNRLLFAAFWLACLVLGNVLPDVVRVVFIALILGAAAFSYAVSSRFFAGRRHLKTKQWVDAIAAFQSFEQELERTSWKRTFSWLAAGIYTRDPVAIARNNVGVVHLENGKLDLAEASFRSALERDRDYAVPHLNLGVAAARRGDGKVMEAELAEAQRLGLTKKKALASVRALLVSRDTRSAG